MFFLMKCLNRPGQNAAREAHRDAHRAWVRSGGDGLAVVLIGSALQDENGDGIGNFGVLEVPDAESARAFAEGDPFHRAGIVETIELTRLPDGFQAHRIAEPLTARK